MRVAERFKRLLGLSGVRVVGVDLQERAGDPLVVVWIARPPRRAMACSGCGQIGRAIYDRIERRWRHRDLGAVRCEIRAEVRRLDRPACGVRAEALAWARPGSRFTRPFEDTCAWLARQCPQSVVAQLMRIDWETVGRIAGRVVAEQRAGADGLDGLVRIGVDEVSWKAGHNYLTVVVCHDSGRVVWVGAGDPARALVRFFIELGPARAGMIEAISLDLAPRFHAVAARHAPDAAICADPFHLVAMAQFALDRLRAAEWQRLRREDPQAGRWLKGVRCALRRGPARRTGADQDLIAELAEANQALYRAHLWCDQLRATLQLGEPEAAAAELRHLAQAAPALRHPRFTRMQRTLTRHAQHILNTIRHRISKGRIEAMNSTVRLLSHRPRGYRRVENLIAPIHLVCGRVRVQLPT